MKKSRSYSRISAAAATLLGKQIQLHRKLKKWSEADLAERTGASRSTIQKIEKGDLTCQIGLAFEAAHLVGVELFSENSEKLSAQQRIFTEINSTTSKLALLPKMIRQNNSELDDEF